MRKIQFTAKTDVIAIGLVVGAHKSSGKGPSASRIAHFSFQTLNQKLLKNDH